MINLLSPIPPAKTGTANYARLLLRDLEEIFPCDDLRIFVDGMYEAGDSFGGIPVFTMDKFDPAHCDINVFAIANNEFHHYVLERLTRDDMKGRNNITIVHDLQILQNLTNLYYSKRFNISEETYCGYFIREFPNKIKGIAFGKWVLSGHLYKILTFTTLGLSTIISNSKTLLVHSYYARSKIRLESGYSQAELPTIDVISHPLESNELTPSVKVEDKHTFKIGCFGWIGEHKRIHVIIESYAALCRAWPDFFARSELVVAGQLPDPSFFDPRGVAERTGVSNKVRFTGYLSDEQFLREIKAIDLQLNLRYPSCGETSGTLYAGRAMSRQTAISNYQSFREESATYHVSVEPASEKMEISIVMRRAFEQWLEGKSSLASPEAQELSKSNAAEMLKSLFALYGASSCP